MKINRELLEEKQIFIYFFTVVLAIIVAFTVSGTTALEAVVNPALGFMLFVTFLQVPMVELKQAFSRVRFLGALLVTNFVFIPLLAGGLMLLLPSEPMIRLGVLLVLLTPCVDYVVTFSHLGRADARLILASTPVLLILQMLFLPVYLSILLGQAAVGLVHVGPFIHAFVWLIVIPLVLAALVQFLTANSHTGQKILAGLNLLPIPATATVLFVVIAAVLPQLGPAIEAVLKVIPIYLLFAIIAPLVGWGMSRLFSLKPPAGRAVAFSAATRNSLVVLPLALAIPGAIPVLPAIIVTQTLIELISQLIYVRLIPLLGKHYK
jgi:ACR3 family arsenite efflux pump ArsB